MAYDREFPYWDPEKFDLSSMLATVKQLEEDFKLFVVMNEVKYAEPLEWSIDTQYEKNTIVQTRNGEKTYLSKQPVPAGINITNTDYWLMLADYAPTFDRLRTSIVPIDIEDSSIAPFDIPRDTILWYRGSLYKALVNIYEGDDLRPAHTLEPTTIQHLIDLVSQRLATAENDISDLALDMTNAKADITTLFGSVGALQTKTTVLEKQVTLYANSWVGTLYTITDSDITTNCIIVLATPTGISASQLSELQAANIQPYAQNNGSIQVGAFGDVPTNDVPVTMLIYRN